jgi:ABC-type multidrug transport system fused ATPase/permease subunit
LICAQARRSSRGYASCCSGGCSRRRRPGSDARETGDLLSRLASDTQKLQAAATETVSLALRSAISALVSFALLFLTSWRLACLATAVVPFLIGATFLAMRVVKRLAKESQAALARAGAVAQEGLANQRVVRSFGAEGFEVGRYAHAVGDPDAAERPAKDSSLALGLRQAGVQAAFITTTAALGYASVLGVWYYGGLLVVRGQMTTGDLVAFVMLLLTITASLSVLAQTGASVVEAVGASVEIFAVIDREPAIPNDWSSKSDSDRATELRLARGDAAGCAFEDVVFSYASRPDLRVLDGLTLRIPAKSRAALVCVEIKFRTPHAIDATFSP